MVVTVEVVEVEVVAEDTANPAVMVEVAGMAVTLEVVPVMEQAVAAAAVVVSGGYERSYGGGDRGGRGGGRGGGDGGRQW
eukprot:CAMPEP_0113846776 /NCGR_PEP_ID=MMETSP0372-20130328/1496_1 /TAXON_ID=340204 /ORGANISM="Lankesteria abbotti" /LENGTH=79 /DNA_ID=CAMNT_0000815959 /DNA_START=787 /DNA_END=1026 /DNA_ORIENTATION=- /assembly_acc=CAM_ASM_000359